VRLDVALVHHLRAELALDDDVGFAKPLFDVAAPQLHAVRDVGRPRRAFRRAPLCHEVVVKNCGAGLQRIVQGHDRRQRVVDDVDERNRLPGDVERRGRDGGDRVARVEHFRVREHVVAHVVELESPFTHRELRGGFGNVSPGDDGLHASQSSRATRVDRDDARVSVRAAQHRAVEHAGKRHVRAVDGTAGHLVDAVVANRPRPHDRKLPAIGAHTAASLIVSAASRTARTILS